MKNKIELSVIILNYNTKELLADCLNSVRKNMLEIPMEVIVSDNASTDGGPQMVRKKFPWVKLVEGPNEGFSKGNNRARPFVNGKMVLFLNPDTVVYKNVFKETVGYLKNHKDVGALTCKLVLPDGRLDKDTRRRFPTPWISFQHLILGNNKNYWYEDVSDKKIQVVDTIQGAYLLTRNEILDKVGWWDEGYYFDGEDLDLCYQIHKEGYKIVYFPKVYITHIKGVTKGKVSKWKHKVTAKQRQKLRLSGVASMERFYKKNLWDKYPILFNYFVILGINFFKIIRYIKVAVLSSY